MHGHSVSTVHGITNRNRATCFNTTLVYLGHSHSPALSQSVAYRTNVAATAVTEAMPVNNMLDALASLDSFASAAQ